MRLAPVLALVFLLINCLPLPTRAANGYFDFQLIKGERTTGRGVTRRYDIYVPKPSGNLAKPPYPLVVLLHGFLRTTRHMSRNAEYLAQRGIVVFVPQMDQWLLGNAKRGKNMNDVVDHVNWLLPRASKPDDELYGVFDPRRLAMMGHSSGGPICLEVVMDLQKQGIVVDSIFLPDGIVWERTMKRVWELQPLDLVSARSESAICNQHASILGLLEKLPFPYRDLKVNGAKHCDPENPTNWGCRCICGPSHNKYRDVFVRLMYVYFKERLKAPNVPEGTTSFLEAVSQLAAAGKITPGKGFVEQLPKLSNNNAKP